MRYADDPTPIICQASWEGMIIDELRGQHGFGYDRCSSLPRSRLHSAQMPAEPRTSSAIGQALGQLKAASVAVVNQRFPARCHSQWGRRPARAAPSVVTGNQGHPTL